MQTDAKSDMALTRAAVGCADHILKRYFKIARSPEPPSLDTATDFDLATVRLATDLQERANPIEALAVAAALEALNVDWEPSTGQPHGPAIDGALGEATKRLNAAAEALGAILAVASAGIFAASRNDVRRFQHVPVREGLSALDQRMMRFLRHSETLFLRDRYGRRSEALGVEARRVVADALAQGLGRATTRDLLASAATRALVQPSSYWQVVAGAFVGRGRSYAQLSAYKEAGIKHYRVVAVMDERTSSVCQRMHGRVLRVQDGIDIFLQAEAAKDPVAISSLNPWPKRHATHSDADLSFPPYHALCRSNTVCET
jgi:SPP1 gp7 family putative phage head morphogenesis protein